MTLKFPASLESRVPLLCWIIVLVTCLLIPVKILSYGYVPVGDARRYVAKAVTEKEYPQIVISGSAYHMDFSPGWEWLLRHLHRATGCDEDALMADDLFFERDTPGNRDQLLVVGLAHIRETRPEAVVVLANQRVVAH